MASELRVDRIIPVNGVPTGGAGGVIQITESAMTTGNVSGTLFQTTSASYVTVFSGSITPTSSSNKILVTLSVNPYAGGTDTLRMNGQILRNSTQVWYSRNLFFRSGGVFKSVQSAIQFLDSPATTSAVTYTFQVQIETSLSGTTGEFYADNSNYNNRMLLMEVSG